jgi:O-antigen/teichoic acid export membrane protein
VSLKKNLVYNFLLSFSQIAFPLVSIPYISRVLDPEGIGSVSFIDSFTYYFIVIAEFGIVSYAIREISRKKDDPAALKQVTSELVSLHLLTSLGSLALYFISISFFYQKVHDPRLILFSLSFLLVNSFACEWYFWGTEQFKYITIRSLVTRALGLASIFILVKKPDDYFIYYAIITGSAIVNIGWNFSKLVATVRIKFNWQQWKKHLPYLFTNYKISLVYSIVLLLDNVFLQLVSTSIAVAYYAFATKIVRLSGAVVTDALLVFYPRSVSLAHKESRAELQHVILRSSELILITTIPMAAGIFILADPFTAVYFGPSFSPLALNLKILALYPLIKALSLFLNKQLLMPYDREKKVLNGLSAGALVFVVFTFPLSYYYADKGTCIAMMISELTVLGFNFYYVQQLKSNIALLKWRAFVHAIAGTVLFLPIIYLINRFLHHDVIALITEVVLCSLAYFAFLALVMKNEVVLSFFRSWFRSPVIAGNGG